jgi:uncharacterized protein (TIGR03435 family)
MPGAALKLVALIVTAAAAALPAQQVQSDAGAAPAFEVASVKPNKGGTSGGGPTLQPNGGYRVTNVALKSVIANAYEVRIFHIEGGPAWLTSDRFDIVARGREGTPDSLRPAMLRRLLVERFKLVAHFETQERPVYSLLLARSDGRLGPQLKPSAPATEPAARFPSASVASGSARITGSRVLMDNLALVLSSSVFTQQVVNRTGLSGEFDIDLRFTPDSSPAGAPEFPSIFTAVQEQLGLKLEPGRAPARVLVIDSVERPTPD